MKILAASLSLLLGMSRLTAAPLGTPPASSSATGTAHSLVRPDFVLQYIEYGSGDPVLALNGGPGFSGASLAPLAQLLAKRTRVILPDCRGTGLSIPMDDKAITLRGTLEDLEALRRSLGLKQWTVLGWSWGGCLAMEYASKFPASLSKLILLGSGPNSFEFAGPYTDTLKMRMTSDERQAEEYWEREDVRNQDPDRAAIEMLRATVPACFYDRSKAIPWIAQFRPGKAVYNPGAEALMPEFELGAQGRIEALRHLDCPTLILYGRQDAMPATWAFENHELIRGSKLVWIERCGHHVFVEQPEALEKALFEFLFP